VSTNISIIIPTYNSEKFIFECISNIYNQIDEKIELIIINDCSTDKTEKICNKFVRKNSYIKLINLKKNSGVSIARNLGIKKSKGKYLIFLDSDDLLINSTLLKINKLIEKSCDKDILFFPSYDPINKVIDNNSLKKKINNKNFFKNISNFNNFRLTCWNFVYNKKFITKHNIQFSNIRIFEEQIFLTKVLTKIKKFKIFKTNLYKRRIIEINSLGAKIGYEVVVACIKNLHELINYYKINYNLNEDHKKFFESRFAYLMNEMFNNMLILKDNEIKNMINLISNKYKFKNKKIYTKTKLNLLFKNKKNLTEILKLKKNVEVNKIFKILNKIANQSVIVYCAGIYSKIIIKLASIFKINIIYICDSNLGFHNQKISNHIIKNKKYLIKNRKKNLNNNFLISNFNIKTSLNIKNELIKIGFKSNKIYCLGN